MTFDRHHVAGITLVAIGAAVKATAESRCHSGLGVDAPSARPTRMPAAARRCRGRRDVGADLRRRVRGVIRDGGVGLGWLTALAGSVKIINALVIPTATANLVHAIGGLFFPVNFYAVLQVTRAAGIAIIAVSLPLLWWRFRP